MNKVKKIKIGKITSAQGLRGELRLFHDSGDEKALMRLSSLFLRINGEETAYRIERLRMQKRTPILKLEGIESREAAEALTGAEVFTLLSESRPNEADAWLVSDLIGLEVALYDTEGEAIGCLKGLIDNPAHDILEIETTNGIRLLPFVDEFVKKVDIDGGKLYIAPPEGWM